MNSLHFVAENAMIQSNLFCFGLFFFNQPFEVVLPESVGNWTPAPPFICPLQQAIIFWLAELLHAWPASWQCVDNLHLAVLCHSMTFLWAIIFT